MMAMKGLGSRGELALNVPVEFKICLEAERKIPYSRN